MKAAVSSSKRSKLSRSVSRSVFSDDGKGIVVHDALESHPKLRFLLNSSNECKKMVEKHEIPTSKKRF